jgi:monoamine oxidase
MNNLKDKKIIIIGAGIAGLAACNHLTSHGFNASILEARSRCGGRIWTEHHFGIPFNLGASWIHGVENNPMTQLAKQSHIEIAAMDFDKLIHYDRNGLPIPNEIVKKFDEKFNLLLHYAKRLAFQSHSDISLSEAISHFAKDHDFSPIEQDIFKAKVIRLENYTGASYEYLSGRHWDDEEDWPGDTSYVVGGFQSILKDLEKNSTIQFNKIVTRINIGAKSVEILTENEAFYADAVIITVPLGVLKKNKIIFDPPLPNDKQDAINRLGMGLFNITAIKFPYPFWPAEKQALRFTQFDDSSISFFFNLHHFSKQAILIGTHGGECAKRLENLTDVQLIEKTMKNFREVFGSDIPDPDFYLNTKWFSDPFSYGSYSYIPTGASSVDYETIANPIANRLFFAGEATSSKYPATTHGAYLSGMREANRIMNSF